MDDPVIIEDPLGLRTVAAAMDRLTAELAVSRPKVENIDRRQRYQLALFAVITVLVLMMGVIALNTRNVSAAIQDCIDPAGRCYQDGRSRTVDVQKAIVSAQHEDVDRTNRNLCALIKEHALDRPPDCPPP